MLNLKNDKLNVKQNIDEAIADRLAQIQDLTNEITALEKQKNTTEIYVTREELSDRFHCDVKKIPRQLLGFRVGKTVLYKQSDIDDFIKTRMKKR